MVNYGIIQIPEVNRFYLFIYLFYTLDRIFPLSSPPSSIPPTHSVYCDYLGQCRHVESVFVLNKHDVQTTYYKLQFSFIQKGVHDM